MSYLYNCPKNDAGDDIEEILYFSNPDVSYEGVPTGDILNNNAKAMTETRDETSQYGTNCYDGIPTTESSMGTKVCSWTPWTGFGEWGDCCCAEDYRECPLVPYQQCNGGCTRPTRGSGRTVDLAQTRCKSPSTSPAVPPRVMTRTRSGKRRDATAPPLQTRSKRPRPAFPSQGLVLLMLGLSSPA